MNLLLNLTPGFNPYKDTVIERESQKINFETFIFKGGEPHIKLKLSEELIFASEKYNVIITQKIKTFEDLGILMLAVDALKRNLQIDTLQLYVPYFPGARQDRAMVVGEPLTAKVYADLINNMKFDTVIIYDAHSDVTPALIDNCINGDNIEFVADVVKDISSNTPLTLISPDAGSNKKIFKVAKEIGNFESVVRCDKARDLETGKIIDFEVYADDLTGKSCLIVDDICDGGGTFLGLAKVLKEKGAEKIYLAVSHGIFSKGIEAFTDFDMLYCTDSFMNESPDKNKLKIISL